MLKLKLADYSTPQLNVYLVDGQYIRDNTYIDFTEGGSWLRYDWIPENEVWIGGVHIIECKLILVHELAEIVYALENNLDLVSEDAYSEAHDHANGMEQAARTAPNTIDEILIDLISQFNEVYKSMEEETLWKV